MTPSSSTPNSAQTTTRVVNILRSEWWSLMGAVSAIA